MKYRNRIMAMLVSVCLLFGMFGIVSQAASGSINISSKSGKVGDAVTITCTINCTSGPIGSADVVLTYSPSALEWVSGTGLAQGGSGSVRYAGVTSDFVARSLSFNMTFKILKEGAHVVSTGQVTAYDIDDQMFEPRGSGTITGTASSSGGSTAPSGGSSSGGNGGSTGSNAKPGTTTNPQDKRDSNNKLKSLKIYPGTLTPAFSAGNTTYSVKVEKDTKEVKISATPQSDKAKVTISGGKDLKPGANTAKVVVVAENGSSIAYVITIMCGEETPITIGGVEYKINENFTDAQIPSGFSRTKISHNGKQYEGLTNGNNTLKLVSLQAAESAQFYVYNEETQEFYPFIQIAIAEGKFIIPLPLSGKVEKYKNAEIISINYQDKSFDAWKLDDEFSIVYAINQDGEEVFYRYDSVDGIFQRQTDLKLDLEETVKKEKKQLFPNQYYMYAIAGLGALSFILFVSMIYFIASRKHRHEARKKKAQRKLEKQKIKEEKQRLREEKYEEKQRLKQEKIEEKLRRKEEKRSR